MYSFEPNFARYLTAKTTVDDRALNKDVWKTLQAHLQEASTCHVLEVGAGVGTMLQRTADWQLFDRLETYTGIDIDAANIQVAQANHPDDSQIAFLVADALTWQPEHPIDLLIANAFMDLVDFAAAMDHFKAIMNASGLFYFPITFDGMTILEPVIDAAFDDKIMALYHADMDQRENGTTAGSRAGRKLMGYLHQRADVDLLAAGSSDWVVYPRATGYEGDEAYFLHFIIATIHKALSGHPELDHDRFEAWIQDRHRQIDNHELIYIAHQIDLLGQFK